MLDGLITNKKIKIITSENVELIYAVDVVKNKADMEEKEGKWKKFGPVTPIYDRETGKCVFIQIMIEK